MGGELSAQVEVLDGTGLQGSRKKVGKNEFLYAYVPASSVKGETYVVTFDGDEETSPKLVAAATLAVYQEYAVVLADQTAAGWAWVQTKGYVSMLVEGTTDVAKDDFLELLTTEKSAKKDAATRSVNSYAIACEAQAANSAVLTKCELLGAPAICAAT